MASAKSVKAVIDVFYIIFLTFMTAAVAYVGFEGDSSETAKARCASISLSLIAVIIAGVFKIADSCAYASSSCMVIAHGPFALICSILVFLCSAVGLCVYPIVSDGNDSFFDNKGNQVWFALTFIATFVSLVNLVLSLLFYKKVTRKGILLN